MKDILEENKRLKSEVEKLIGDNMELTAVIRSLRKNAREDTQKLEKEAEHHDRMVGELEKVYKERDEAKEQTKELIYIAERAIVLAEIDFENDKFGVVSELRDGVERIKEAAK